MNFLILYGISEGQTGKIATFFGERTRSHGHTTTILDATNPEVDYLKLHNFDGVIAAASLHLGFYQAAVEHLCSQAPRHAERHAHGLSFGLTRCCEYRPCRSDGHGELHAALLDGDFVETDGGPSRRRRFPLLGG